MEIIEIRNIEEAKEELEKIGCDSRGIEIMASKFVFRVIKILDIDARAANIIKQEMLSADGEAAVKKGTISYKEKRTDILLSGTIKQLEKVAGKINYELFGLNEISEKIKSAIK